MGRLSGAGSRTTCAINRLRNPTQHEFRWCNKLAFEPLAEEETSGKCTKVSFRWITLFVKNIYNFVALLASGDKERPTIKEQRCRLMIGDV